MNQNDDGELSRLLRRWEPDAEVPRDFRSSVWSQIAARAASRPSSLFDMVISFFSRPAYGATAAVVALVISLGLAHWNAGRVIAERRSEAVSEYLSSISPLARVSADGATLAMNHGHE